MIPTIPPFAAVAAVVVPLASAAVIRIRNWLNMPPTAVDDACSRMDDMIVRRERAHAVVDRAVWMEHNAAQLPFDDLSEHVNEMFEGIAAELARHGEVA